MWKYQILFLLNLNLMEDSVIWSFHTYLQNLKKETLDL